VPYLIDEYRVRTASDGGERRTRALPLALAGTVIAVGEIRAFIGLGLAFIAFFLKTVAEERFMREEFSGEYAQYSQRVRRLIPFIL
jgi:protein-S-isoprenylcysteine O-methyltransferase Ste14